MFSGKKDNKKEHIPSSMILEDDESSSDEMELFLKSSLSDPDEDLMEVDNQPNINLFTGRLSDGSQANSDGSGSTVVVGSEFNK